MISVDTQSGNIFIDTETEPVKKTIVITRNAAGTQIRYITRDSLQSGELANRRIAGGAAGPVPMPVFR